MASSFTEAIGFDLSPKMTFKIYSNQSMHEEISSLVEEGYDIGELVGIEQLNLGFVNQSFIIHTKKDNSVRKYLLRKYHAETTEDGINFEHSLINHLRDKKFLLIAELVPNRDGSSFVVKKQHLGGDIDATSYYFAIFEYLEGDDRFTWVNPQCSHEVLRNSASVLAGYHSAVVDFQPKGNRDQAKIINLLPEILDFVQFYRNQSKGTKFDEYFFTQSSLIENAILFLKQFFYKHALTELPELVIHCDFHPGNLKFDGDRVLGLFDFDWCKEDMRCFDVGLAIFYFCTDWGLGGNQGGILLLDKVSIFLKSYILSLRSHSGDLDFTDLEKEILPHMIAAGNIFILYWTLSDYAKKQVDVDEYLGYLQHGIGLIEWFEDSDNRSALEEVCSS